MSAAKKRNLGDAEMGRLVMVVSILSNIRPDTPHCHHMMSYLVTHKILKYKTKNIC